MTKYRYGLIDNKDRFTMSSDIAIRNYFKIKKNATRLEFLNFLSIIKDAFDYALDLKSDGNVVIGLKKDCKNINVYEMCNKENTFKQFRIK
jgi:hypothetical protein